MRTTNYLAVAVAVLALAVVTQVTSPTARGQAARLGPAGRAGAFQLPEVGAKLPEVTVYDDQGREFSTSSLRGSYTVLVFGCLT